MTQGVSKVELHGQRVRVELRQGVNRFFVVYPDLGLELVMSFEHRWTAFEMAVNTVIGSPFYIMVPTVKYQTPWPRPWLKYPKSQPVDVPFIMTD